MSLQGGSGAGEEIGQHHHWMSESMGSSIVSGTTQFWEAVQNLQTESGSSRGRLDPEDIALVSLPAGRPRGGVGEMKTFPPVEQQLRAWDYHAYHCAACLRGWLCARAAGLSVREGWRQALEDQHVTIASRNGAFKIWGGGPGGKELPGVGTELACHF